MELKPGFPTVSDFIDTITGNVRSVIVTEQRRPDAETMDVTEISRRTPVADIMRAAARHYLADPTDAAVDQVVSAAITELNGDFLSQHGVELRHVDIWCLYPVEIVHAQVAAMKHRNQQISGRITPQDFVNWLEEYGVADHTPDEIEKKSDLREAIEQEWNLDRQSATPMADILQEFADDWYINLSSSELRELERKRTLTSICNYLTEKLHERTPNDGFVQYGTMRGGARMQQEREQFIDRWGGIHGAGAGLAVKHIEELFDILGSTFGILDRVPEEDRTGPLEGAHAPIRIWLRTAPRDITKGTYGLASLSKERNYYQAASNPPHLDYRDHDAMLDDGWVLD